MEAKLEPVSSIPKMGKAGQETDRRLICFLAAPCSTDLTVIRQVLLERGVRAVVPSEVSPRTPLLLEHLADLIARSDFVLAVLDSGSVNANVAFELGCAYGLGKRALLLAPPDTTSIPFDLDSFPIFRLDPRNRTAMGYVVDQALASEDRAMPRLTHRYTGRRRDRQVVRDLLAEVERRGDALTESEAQRLIETALQAAGVQAVARSPHPDKGADLAIWDDDLYPLVGAPILIEIKRRVASVGEVRDAAQQVLAYLQSSNAMWALVIFLSGNPPKAALAESKAFPIRFLSLTEFLQSLATRGLVELVRELRKQWAHGREP
jgi:Restriction endonuclease